MFNFFNYILMKFKKYLLLLSLVFATSCACNSPLKVTPVQRGDKGLNCKQLILEIIESENYRTMAEESKGVSASEALTPSCWVTGYISSQTAIKLANSRINYLGNIYDLNNCETKGNEISNRRPQRVQTITTEIPGNALRQAPAGLTAVTPPSSITPPPNFGFTNPSNSNNNQKDGYNPISNSQPLRDIPHEHKDVNGKTYEHSHPHRGFHLHGEDQ